MMAYTDPGSEGFVRRYAGFWLRFWASLIDGILLAIAFGILGALTGIQHFDRSFYSTILTWLYFALMESSSHQATLGKLALGLVVTDGSGGRISFGRATGRHFAKIISGIILLIGFLMAGWTEKKQALHDLIADTLVMVH